MKRSSIRRLPLTSVRCSPGAAEFPESIAAERPVSRRFQASGLANLGLVKTPRASWPVSSRSSIRLEYSTPAQTYSVPAPVCQTRLKLAVVVAAAESKTPMFPLRRLQVLRYAFGGLIRVGLMIAPVELLTATLFSRT